MGQKINPIGFRVGVIRGWESRWYAEGKKFTTQLHEDIKIRDTIKKRLYDAGISKVEIERHPKETKVYIHVARPGLIIGKRGQSLEQLKAELQKLTKSELYIHPIEVRRAEIDAQLVAENIALQLQRRVAFRRAMKKAVQTTMRLGAKGIRVSCSGRLGGAEMARYEWYLEGRVPLHTLRADIDYGYTRAETTYGAIGVKVWIYKGDIIGDRPSPGARTQNAPAPQPAA